MLVNSDTTHEMLICPCEETKLQLNPHMYEYYSGGTETYLGEILMVALSLFRAHELKTAFKVAPASQ